MKFYAERNQLLGDSFNLDFSTLKKYFYQTFMYFNNKEYFNLAEKGVWISRPYHDEEEQLIAPTMAPSPEIYFLNHCKSSEVFPVWEYYEYYTETILFTVIEILYEHIGFYNFKKSVIEKDAPREEFADHINNILKFYKNGYYLDPKAGIITEMPNDTLKILLQEELPVSMGEDVISKMKSAIKLYYRFDADMESKKKAITILADILEIEREELKNVLNQEYDVNKNDHDKLIFEIVNNFNIRHNNQRQFTEYKRKIWYDWMMQYYCSVILTYFKLKTSFDW